MKTPKKTTSPPKVRSLDDVLANYPLLATEDAGDYFTIRASLFEDLAPRSAMARMLADNIVSVEWERRRYISMVRTIVMTNVRVRLRKELEAVSSHEVPLAVIDRITDAFEAGPRERFAAELRDARLEIDIDQIVSEVWTKQLHTISLLEDQIKDAEKRRRRLLADLDAYQKRVRAPIPEAETIDHVPGH